MACAHARLSLATRPNDWADTNEEIARRLDCVPRTVERKISRIRLLWKQELKELGP
jgi:hypothetical protein